MPLFTPPYGWAPITVDQGVTNEPSLETLSSSLSYNHMTGLLGCDVTIGVHGSSDHTDDDVTVREELWVDVTLPSNFASDLAVTADFETVEADHKILEANDEPGVSDLYLNWKTQPYVTTGYPKGSRVYDSALFSGGWDPDSGQFVLGNDISKSGRRETLPRA
jgi:hypothetical protein